MGSLPPRVPLREPVNVPDLLARDRIVLRLKAIYAEAVQSKRDAEHWNRAHPDQAALDTSLFDEVIAWCAATGEAGDG